MEEEPFAERPFKKSNTLPIWGNDKTMNLNTLLLTNIQSSQYFKVSLFKLKTYHEVLDELYYQVNHLEPWEKGSRKTAGQTGMCGGVRGVGAGGIVSTAFCILYKFFTLRLTRKQIMGMINHTDSPYIRGIGFMYLRYTQPPADLWEWFEPYLDDEEEVEVRAGGGQSTTIGAVAHHMLTKLDWYATLFPRIPVPIQKQIEQKLKEKYPPRQVEERRYNNRNDFHDDRSKTQDFKDRNSKDQRRDRDRNSSSRDYNRGSRDRDRDNRVARDDRDKGQNYRDKGQDYRDKEQDYRDDRYRGRDNARERYGVEKSYNRDRNNYSGARNFLHDKDRRYEKSRDGDHYRGHSNKRDDYSKQLDREKDRIRRDKRSRSKSRDRERKRRD